MFISSSFLKLVHMQTMMLCVTGICLFLFAFGSPNRLYSAHPDAPYIYYYSPSKQAFIIERADGQDSRVLTSYNLPEETVIKGPGWSKDEQWFAWTAKVYAGGSIPTNVYIV